MKTKIIVAALVLAAPLAASADVSYKYAEIGYVKSDIDVGGNPDGTSFNLKGMFPFTDSVYGVLDYTDGEYEAGPFQFDVSQMRIGAGYHRELSNGVDGIAELTLDNIDGGTSESGFGLKFGLRGMATEALELNGHLRYTSVDSVSSSDTLLGVGLAWGFSDNMALTFGYETGDISGWGVGFRAAF